MSSRRQARGAVSQDTPPIQKMSLHSNCTQVSYWSSQSNIRDTVRCVGPWVRLECRLLLYMDSVARDTVINRPRFPLISGIRRHVLRSRNGGGIASLFIPDAVYRRWISDIERNRRYELIWVRVLDDPLSMKRIMERCLKSLLRTRRVTQLIYRNQKNQSSHNPLNKVLRRRVPNENGRRGKWMCEFCRGRKIKVFLVQELEF